MLGAGLLLDIHYQQAPLASAYLVYEQEKDSYKVEEPTTDKSAAELGLFGTTFLRVGRCDDHSGRVHLTTYGVGFSLRGLLDWFEQWGWLPTDDVFGGRGPGSIDLTVDFGRYEGSDGSVLDGTEFFQVAFSME